jgi:hypothetical protein
MDYEIAVNPVTGEEYKIYKNGTVTDIYGSLITTRGVIGL